MFALLVLAVALVVSVVGGVVYAARNGRFRGSVEEDAVSDVASGRPRLTPADIGADLGEKATLVQVSTAFCAPCRATRRLLTDVVTRRPGVETVDVDAESHLELVRRLDVRRTPTVLLLDADGVVLTRSSGLPRRPDVERLLDAVGAPADPSMRML
ncbi:TlpA family protein disulfide reductase [Solicola sp. PLA-1-18]|uniref:TlpA family protein disulfide reductase n=1 Tax=Solicola sp. PLA-1-18 TaxID=3380532 RepID=UPI003B76AA12